MKILQIFVQEIGYIHSNDDGEITKIQKAGDGAMVDWYKKGKREWNGRYVIEVVYELPNI